MGGKGEERRRGRDCCICMSFFCESGRVRLEASFLQVADARRCSQSVSAPTQRPASLLALSASRPPVTSVNCTRAVASRAARLAALRRYAPRRRHASAPRIRTAPAFGSRGARPLVRRPRSCHPASTSPRRLQALLGVARHAVLALCPHSHRRDAHHRECPASRATLAAHLPQGSSNSLWSKYQVRTPTSHSAFR